VICRDLRGFLKLSLGCERDRQAEVSVKIKHPKSKNPIIRWFELNF